MKQLDYQMNTNQSAELCVGGNCRILAGEGIPSMKALLTADPNFNIFVATVYGETISSLYLTWQGTRYYGKDVLAGTITDEMLKTGNLAYERSSLTASKAVASVIMNRVGKGYWRNLKTPIAVIEQPAQFDAYDQQNPPYLEAYNALKAGDLDSVPGLQNLLTALKPIYYGTFRTTTATHYYSPLAEAANPKYGLQYSRSYPAMNNYKAIPVLGLQTFDDFAFYIDQ